MTVMVINIIIIISIDTIITMILQHAGFSAALPAVPPPKYNSRSSQFTSVLWLLVPFRLAALLILRHLVSRLVAILKLQVVLLW